jgi:hypothetical protein
MLRLPSTSCSSLLSWFASVSLRMQQQCVNKR